MRLRQTSRARRRPAFTLLEMLVVVAIIVALAGVGGYYLMGALSGSQKDIARTQVKGALTTAVEKYRIDNHTYPGSLQELYKVGRKGVPYLSEPDAVKDPWGNTYNYDPSGSNNNGLRPDIWAVAPDGQKIGNWSETQ